MTDRDDTVTFAATAAGPEIPAEFTILRELPRAGVGMIRKFPFTEEVAP